MNDPKVSLHIHLPLCTYLKNIFYLQILCDASHLAVSEQNRFATVSKEQKLIWNLYKSPEQ